MIADTDELFATGPDNKPLNIMFTVSAGAGNAVLDFCNGGNTVTDPLAGVYEVTVIG